MAQNAYSVDMTEATRPAFEAAKDVTEMQGLEQKAAYMRESTAGLKQQNAIGEIALNKARYEEKQAAEEQKRGETVVPVKGYFKQYGITSPEEQKFITNKLREGGFIQDQPDGEAGMKMKHSKQAMDYLESDKVGRSQFGKLRIQHLNNQIKENEEKLADPKIQKDPEAVKKIQADIAKMEASKVAVNNDIMKNDDKIRDTLEGVDSAVKSLGADVLAKNPALAAAAEAAKKTGDATEFNKILTEVQKGKTQEQKDKAAMERTKETGKSRERAAGIKARASSGDNLPNIPAGKPGEVNTGALSGLNNTQSETVEAIAEYRFPVSNLRNKNMMALVQRAYAYDPTFDAKEYAVRASVRKDFTSGKTANNINSLNTAVGHLEQLYDKAQALDNSRIPLWNYVANRGLQFTGDKRVAGFNNTATAVESELAAVFKGMGATDQEIKAWRDNFSSSSSPAQFRESIVDASTKLMGSRLDALRNKYQQGMGKPANFKLLSAKSHDILKKLGADTNMIDPGDSQAPAGGAAPQKIGRFIVEAE